MPNWVVLCEATQYVVAATDHCILSGGEIRSDEMRRSEMSDMNAP